MALYVTLNDIKLRVAAKIRFTDDADAEPDKMSNQLARRLLDEAEADVEHDLSERYLAPFQTIAGAAFANLPERPTKQLIKTLAEHKATIRFLETDFGSGSPVTGDEYMEKLQERYDKMLERLMKRRDNTFNHWAYPPLPDLKLAYHNEAADDGFSGTIHVADQGDGSFPQYQINDPSENLWNGEVDGLDD